MKIFYWIIVAVVVFIQPNLFSNSLFSKRKPISENNNNQPKQMENAEYFEGFDINFGVGYSGITLHTTRKGIKPSSSTNYGADGVALQLKLGGNYAFYGKGLVGVEVYGQYNSAETKNKFFETATSTINTKRTFSMNWNLGIDARLGFSPCSSNLIFIYGGPDWGRYDFHYVTTGVNNTYEKFHLGGALGAGLEQIFADCWIIRTTFDYRWYPSHTISYSNGESQTIKPRLATTLFMIGYMF